MFRSHFTGLLICSDFREDVAEESTSSKVGAKQSKKAGILQPADYDGVHGAGTPSTAGVSDEDGKHSRPSSSCNAIVSVAFSGWRVMFGNIIVTRIHIGIPNLRLGSCRAELVGITIRTATSGAQDSREGEGEGNPETEATRTRRLHIWWWREPL